MNIGVQVSFWIRVLSWYMPRSGILDYMETQVFWGTSILFSIVVVPIYDFRLEASITVVASYYICGHLSPQQQASKTALSLFPSCQVNSRVVTRPHTICSLLSSCTLTLPAIILPLVHSLQPFGLLASDTQTRAPAPCLCSFPCLECSSPKTVTWFHHTSLVVAQLSPSQWGLSWTYCLKSECISFASFPPLSHLPALFFSKECITIWQNLVSLIY